MLDILLFRTDRGHDPERVRESQRRRFASVELVDEVIKFDTEWRQRQHELRLIQTEYNKLNKEISILRRKGENATELERKAAEQDKLRAEKEEQVELAFQEMDKRLRLVGNIVHDSVPISDDEANNEVVRTWGTRREEAKLKNHVDLVDALGIADLKKGSDIAGGRGYFLKGLGVRLNQALINFALDFLEDRNFEALQTPFFMRKDVMAECAQLAQFDEELYKVTGEGDDKYLIATSEQPLCAYHRKDWIVDTKSLPIRYAGVSTCFRKEAGAHGKDTLGIFRVHQFEKVEQFVLTSPHDDESWKVHEELIANSEEFYRQLGLPHRVVSIVAGALNDAAAKKYDLEAWFPASATYRELVSCSNCTDYQSRNLEIRYGQKKEKGNEKLYVHLLNSTLTATERTMCCILENYQTPTGVDIPGVLQPYMRGLKHIPFVGSASKKQKDKIKQEQQTQNGPLTPPTSE